MAQIVHHPNFGSELGTALGTGIGQGLSALADYKVKQLQKKYADEQIATGLESLGIPKDQAKALSAFNPQLVQEFVKSHLQGQREKEFQQAWMGQQGQQPGVEGAQPSSLQEQLGTQGFPAPRNSREAFELAKIGLQQKHEKQREVKKEEEEIAKETLPIYNELTKEAKVAEHNDKRLNRLEELATKGKLGSPIANALIKTASKGIFGFGIDLSALRTNDAQEFEKISTDFVRDAKNIFGNRLTDTDLTTFLATVPSLSQSREGMLRIIKNMRVSNAAAKLRKQAADLVIAENNGKRPRNLDVLVEQKVGPELDKLAEQFEIPKLKRSLAGSESLANLAKSTGLIY